MLGRLPEKSVVLHWSDATWPAASTRCFLASMDMDMAIMCSRILILLKTSNVPCVRKGRETIHYFSWQPCPLKIDCVNKNLYNEYSDSMELPHEPDIFTWKHWPRNIMCRHFAGNATLVAPSCEHVTIIYPILEPWDCWLDVVFGPKPKGCRMIHS